MSGQPRGDLKSTALTSVSRNAMNPFGEVQHGRASQRNHSPQKLPAMAWSSAQPLRSHRASAETADHRRGLRRGLCTPPLRSVGSLRLEYLREGCPHDRTTSGGFQC